MYATVHFKNEDITKQYELVLRNPLGTLIVESGNGFEVNHIPFLLDLLDGEATYLRAHMPKANPLNDLASHSLKCVVVIQGAQGYITPSWYATKKNHGKVVPTWNYEVVHVHGTLRLVSDKNWIFRQLNDITDQNEAHRKQAWSVSDAPSTFTDSQIRALVGLEVVIDRMEGKIKASQNQPGQNKESVLDSLDNEMPNSDMEKMVRSALTNNS